MARDTFAGYYNSSQSQNRFTYTQNNPIRYIDPKGHYGWDDFIAEGKSLINDPVGHTLAHIKQLNAFKKEKGKGARTTQLIQATLPNALKQAIRDGMPGCTPCRWP